MRSSVEIAARHFSNSLEAEHATAKDALDNGTLFPSDATIFAIDTI
jgi:hypothetical protein